MGADLGNFRRRVWLPALKQAAVPAIHFRDLRHTGNTLLRLNHHTHYRFYRAAADHLVRSHVYCETIEQRGDSAISLNDW